ncbi:putative HAT dimerization domain, ribonuclease H-like superfamily, hAT-like transposase, RNase-H [Helianthus annuus]|nr:putative HAT dimerization domain, ribonuclease H-like superfamily, hAT-like transposase, RNase-H [Helianthus annuus]
MTAWKFDQKIVRKGLAYMIIVEELPFRFVERKAFRYFMSLSQPLFKVPSRSTITRDIYNMFLEEKRKVRDFIKNNVGRICLTTDTWTSNQQSSYMCLTAHFIDNEWKLRNKVLAFCLQENHRGVDIGKAIEKCLQEWEIENILTVSVDNASANDVAIDFLKKVFQNSSKCLLNAKWIHIRCVAHIINLVVQDGIKKVDKSVNKIRWAVWWIRKSPSRIDKFNEFAKVVNANTQKHLLLDVPTRWNSTYLMLEVAQSYEKTFERYDIEESVFRTELEKAGHNEIKSEDWQSVRTLCHFLKPFYDITQRVSGTHYVTSNSCIDEIYQIRDILDKAIGSNTLCQIAMTMNEKFRKYYGDIKKVNLLLYFALVLDPRNKKHYLNLLFIDRYGKELAEKNLKIVMDSMSELYNEYIRIHSQCSSTTTTTESSDSSTLGKRQNLEDTTSKSHLRNKLREQMQTQTVEPVGELDKFLNEGFEKDSGNFNLLEWWKVNSPRFPILSLMARDLFAIPVSTVASESVFSTSGRVLDPYRSSLTPRIVQSLVCTQDWLRDGSTSIQGLLDEEDWDTIQEIDKALDTEENT